MDIWYDAPREENPGLLAVTGLPKRLFGVSLEALAADSKPRLAIQKWLGSGLKQRIKMQGRGLYLHGPFGTGKSSLAAIVLRRVVAHGARARWFRQDDVIRWWLSQDQFEEGAQTRGEILRGCELMAIDNLTIDEKKLIWMEELVRARYDDLKSTLITTNIEPSDLRERAPGLWSIIRGSMDVLSVRGKNWREESA